MLEIENYNQIISNWINLYYEDGFFLLIGVVAFVYLYVVRKELRNKWLLPIFLMMFIIVNPILYKYVFSRIVYWRLLWMLPNTILIVTAVVTLIRRLAKEWIKLLVLVIVATLIIFKGEYVFSEEIFSLRSNWEKISHETIEVGDIILSVDKEPRVVVPTELLPEIRQYAPEISLIYGRNAVGFIRHMEWYYRDLYESMNNGNYEYVLLTGVNTKINFVVVPIDKEIEEGFLDKYQYEEIGRTTKYIVYYNEEIKYVP